jgi:hypothetical protein
MTDNVLNFRPRPRRDRADEIAALDEMLARHQLTCELADALLEEARRLARVARIERAPKVEADLE